MEGIELALFMACACLVVAAVEYPQSIVGALGATPFVRRTLTGAAMGMTAIAIVYSPLGRRSGAHFNPSVTLTFWRLGKISSADALFYATAQFLGGAIGVFVAQLIIGPAVAHPTVNFVATIPGDYGVAVAFIAETVISFVLMIVVLNMSTHPILSPYTGVICGILVATYISLEAPLSGMSMNPARTFASAFVGHVWTAIWVYFIAPPAGMLLAAEVHLRSRARTACAKLYHDRTSRCIFCGQPPTSSKANS